MADDDMDARISVLEQQQAMQTNGLRAALEARWAGEADSLDGWVKALNPGIETDPQTPLYG